MVLGVCQLCLQEKELQKKCHIIPKFFQKTLNPDGDRRAAIVTNGKWKIQQDHFYASYVFCRDCENVLLNQQAEHPVSLDYLRSPDPFFDDDLPMMRLAVSVCFRSTMAWQSSHPEGDYIGPIRSWRRWLQLEEPGPLLYRVGALTYNRDADLTQWQSIMRGIMCFDVVEYEGISLIWINVPGVVFYGVLDADGTKNPLEVISSKERSAEMVEQVSWNLAQKHLSSFPPDPPTGLLERLIAEDRGVVADSGV